jgi:hypothetical protein
VSHCDAVIHADGIEFERDTSGSAYAFLYDFAELLQMDMAWHDINVGIHYSYERFVEILVAQPSGAQ